MEWSCTPRKSDGMGHHFVFLQSLDKRERFMADLTETLSRCPFVLISAVIHKTRLREQYIQPENPYPLALRYCLERTYELLRDRSQHELDTPFLFERRGKKEDAELELAFRRLCGGASCWGQMPGFSIEFFDKKANLTGWQIADLVSMPIGQHAVRPEKRNRAFEMIQQKFRRLPDDDAPGWGMKVFPQKTKGLDKLLAEALRRSGTTPSPVARILPRES